MIRLPLPFLPQARGTHEKQVNGHWLWHKAEKTSRRKITSEADERKSKQTDDQINKQDKTADRTLNKQGAYWHDNEKMTDRLGFFMENNWKSINQEKR